jgi:hypothetical protein
LGIQRAHTLIPFTSDLDAITRTLERVANEVLVRI